MKKKTAASENAKICKAALRLAAKSWAQVTLASVAKESKIPLAKFKIKFASPNDIAALIVDETSREALTSAPKPKGAAHDILFNLLMARFDILQKNRRAILNIADAAKRDCALSRSLAKASRDSVYALADASKITSPPRPVLALGIAAVHACAFLAWRRDHRSDMAKTMAALDRALRLAGKAAGLFKQNS